MAPKQGQQAAALADAFASLVSEDQPVTVRALRERARVGTDAARRWLLENRPAAEVPPVPTDALTPVLGPLWSAAVTAARDEQAEAVAAERAALTAAETEALDDAATQRQRAEQAETQLAAATDDVAELRTALDDAQRLADEAQQARAEAIDAETAARERAHAAEIEASEARATARTLREVLDAGRRDNPTH